MMRRLCLKQALEDRDSGDEGGRIYDTYLSDNSKDTVGVDSLSRTIKAGVAQAVGVEITSVRITRTRISTGGISTATRVS